MTMRSVAYVGALALLAQLLSMQGCGGSNSPSTTEGTGGAPGMGGSTDVVGSGGTATATGGTTTPPTTPTGTGGAAAGSDAGGGTTGTTTYEPLCDNLTTAAGVAPTKNGICLETDPQLCYKNCGPQSIGFKYEKCQAGVYAEQSGCDFLPGDYTCYKVPDPFVLDPTCPTEVPQATVACSVAPCVLCNIDGNYLDSKGNAKEGYCVCPPVANPDAGTTSKWSCASKTAWPCPAGQGC